MVGGAKGYTGAPAFGAVRAAAVAEAIPCAAWRQQRRPRSVLFRHWHPVQEPQGIGAEVPARADAKASAAADEQAPHAAATAPVPAGAD